MQTRRSVPRRPSVRALRLARAVVWLTLAAAIGACSPHPTAFSEARARAHVDMLAGTIGSRPTGSDANRRAREYVADELRQAGLQVALDETDALRPELGVTTHVVNVVAYKEGRRPDALALVAHYDSSPDSPGASDDGLGVAVALETARVVGNGPRRNYSVIVLLTDSEEIGLSGAVAFAAKQARDRHVRAFVNLDAIGAAGPSWMFQAGPGNAWIVRAWARAIAWPAGSSMASEIYRRLPNDTDFTVLTRTGAPGLNFAPIRDGYAYHSALDEPRRLTDDTIRRTGHGIVSLLDALDAVDLNQRSTEAADYFAVGPFAVVYGARTSMLLTMVAVLLAIAAIVRLRRSTRESTASLLVTAAWLVVATIAAVLMMLVAVRVLRTVHGVAQPWYASPDRFFALLVWCGVTAAWLVGAVAWLVPAALRPTTTVSGIWTVTLPIWIVLAIVVQRLAPGAAYAWDIPLMVAAIALLALPPDRRWRARVMSVAVLASAVVFWCVDWLEVLRFSVAALGRLPIRAPAVLYPALILIPAIVLAPPIVTLLVTRPAWPRRVTGVVLAGGLAALLIACASAAPYTPDHPMRRQLRFVQDVSSGGPFWEIAANESVPSATTGPDAPSTWSASGAPPPLSLSTGASRAPYVWRAAADRVTCDPIDVDASASPIGDGLQLAIRVRPSTPGAIVVFALPPGVTPRRASLPGVYYEGRWRATVVAPPAAGAVLDAIVPRQEPRALDATRILVLTAGVPGGVGWQRLPAWLSVERTVWSARSYCVVPAFSPNAFDQER